TSLHPVLWHLDAPTPRRSPDLPGPAARIGDSPSFLALHRHSRHIRRYTVVLDHRVGHRNGRPHREPRNDAPRRGRRFFQAERGQGLVALTALYIRVDPVADTAVGDPEQGLTQG